MSQRESETSSPSIPETPVSPPKKKRASNMRYEEMVELVRIFDARDYDCKKGNYGKRANARKDRIVAKVLSTLRIKFGQDRTRDQVRKRWSDLKTREEDQLRRIRRVIDKRKCHVFAVKATCIEIR